MKVIANGWQFNTDRMKAELQNIINLTSTVHADGLTGISLTSRTGDILSGFEYTPKIMYPPFHTQLMTEEYPKIFFDLDICKTIPVYHMLDYDVPTPALTGYFKEIHNFLVANNCNPRRMRLSCLTPGRTIPKHSDGGGFKLHIPIVTDPDVVFNVNNKNYILEEGNVYIVDVGVHHFYVNNSDIDRWHLICDVYDTGHNFEIGNYTQEEFEIEKENADLWRTWVDGTRTQGPHRIRLGEKN
jgi:quercetin dioxygenase-like cupin family protein